MSVLKKIARELSKNAYDPIILMNNTLKEIEEKNKDLFAFIEVDKEAALKKASEAARRLKEGKPLSEYDGIPVAIKDNILRKDEKAECASKILEGFISPYDAHVIERLNEKGMIPLGRANMDEFAMGSSTENSAFGVTRNAVDPEYAPGGSSGGSAVAVASGMVPVSLGSDTGGSIRQPAAFNGIVGLKPTYGSVSRYGLVAFGSSLDQIGPLTKKVEDSEILYGIINGWDKRDSTSVIPEKRSEWEKKITLKNPEDYKVAVPADLIKGISPEVKTSFEGVLSYLNNNVLKNKIEMISMPAQNYATPVYYITATSEASANLARFDGIRYGKREPSSDLREVYENSRTRGFGAEVKRRILLGTYALSSGYYDAYYGKAQKVRAMIHQEYMNIFSDYDIILMPTTPDVPFKLGEKVNDPVSMYLADVLTTGASLAGVPSLNVPAVSDDLPVGLQIQGPFFSEEKLFTFGKLIEKMGE